VLGDVYEYLLRRPATATHVEIRDGEVRNHYGRRIADHLGISVDDYAVLNIHRIGIDAPVDAIYRAIPRNGAQTAFWPNHLARVEPGHPVGSEARVHAFGWRHLLLFRLTEIRVPEVDDSSRHLLFRSEGGYPDGIFAMFVRPTIPELNEERASQFFFVVSFNFYGRPHRFGARVVQRVWEAIHNRAAAHILNRFRQHCEYEARRAEIRPGAPA